MSNVPTSRTNSSKQSTGQELRARIDDSVSTLAKAVDEVRASEMFQAFLDVQARFHQYSWGNCLLILSQRPSATQVAGYRKWQTLKRQVRKGERSIRILAPCPYKREVDRANGETETVQGMFFRCVSVFDVAQTDGDPLPTLDVPDVEQAADDLLGDLLGVASAREIRVNLVDALEQGAYGVSRGGLVEIATQGNSTGQQAKTLAHEFAHEALHKANRAGLTKTVAEAEAESVAYVVCRHFGLDVEVRASRYIALWGGVAENLRNSLERIAKTARAMIDDVQARRCRGTQAQRAAGTSRKAVA